MWTGYSRVLTQVSAVCCGWSHSMCIDEHGVLLSWGRGEAGCLGHGDSGDRHLPTPVDALPSRAALIAAGCAQYNTLQHGTACRNVQSPPQRTGLHRLLPADGVVSTAEYSARSGSL